MAQFNIQAYKAVGGYFLKVPSALYLLYYYWLSFSFRARRSCSTMLRFFLWQHSDAACLKKYN